MLNTPAIKTQEVVELSSKSQISRYLNSADRILHIYEIGDLDDFFWSYTRWFGLLISGEIVFVVMLYSGTTPPTVIAHGDNTEHGRLVLQAIDFPESFHSHLSTPLIPTLSEKYVPSQELKHYRMELVDSEIADYIDTSSVQQLSSEHLSHIQLFYRESYPGNWFNSRMLETGQAFGIFLPSGNCNIIEFAAISGVHVYSTEFGVAALGNIAVHPSHRNKGYGKLVTAALVKNLLKEGIATVGLNVEANNAAAIKCYTAIGFEIKYEFYEVMWSSLERKNDKVIC